MAEFDPFPSDPRVRLDRAITSIAAGRMVILVDDENRENEGDLVMAADKCNAESINFMASHGRGLICMPMTSERITALELPMMVRANGSAYGTAFTVSIEARTGVSTGISAADRARTIAAAVDPESGPADLVSPGHVFPLRARDGGVLVRAGQTEGSVDLARLAGCTPAGVICEIMNEDGSMSRLPELIDFGRRHRIEILTVADLIAFRLQEEQQVRCVASATLLTDGLGEVQAHIFRNQVNDLQYLALVKGEVEPGTATLVRVHSSDVWGDALLAFRNDGGPLLNRSMRMISEAGSGVVLYVLRPFDGDSVLRRLATHGLRFEGDLPDAPPEREPYPTGQRDYGLGAQVLRSLGVRRIRLMTNGGHRLVGVGGYGLEVVERVAVPSSPSEQRAELHVLSGEKS